jgi:hypothetical protein
MKGYRVNEKEAQINRLQAELNVTKREAVTSDMAAQNIIKQLERENRRLERECEKARNTIAIVNGEPITIADFDAKLHEFERLLWEAHHVVRGIKQMTGPVEGFEIIAVKSLMSSAAVFALRSLLQEIGVDAILALLMADNDGHH